MPCRSKIVLLLRVCNWLRMNRSTMTQSISTTKCPSADRRIKHGKILGEPQDSEALRCTQCSTQAVGLTHRASAT